MYIEKDLGTVLCIDGVLGIRCLYYVIIILAYHAVAVCRSKRVLRASFIDLEDQVYEPRDFLGEI